MFRSLSAASSRPLARGLAAFALALLALLPPLPAAAYNDRWGDGKLDAIRQQYGEAAAQRVQAWLALMSRGEGWTEQQKLQAVNDFFNRVPYADDLAHWGRAEYWATPVELLASNGGDCEDYAVAKYYTLRAMGVPDERLRITYVTARQGSSAIAHMVLGYYATPDADPLVLDNLNRQIRPGSQRTDLSPIYIFNAEGLWYARQRGQNERLGGSDNVRLWNDVRARIERERR